MKEEIYKIKIHCKNCSNEWCEEIPKGQKVEGHKSICPYCGVADSRNDGRPKIRIGTSDY